MTRRFSFLMLFLVGLAACTHALHMAQADVERGAAKFPGLTRAELEQGKLLYGQRCDRCHVLEKPESRDEEEWKDIVPVMARKAKLDDHTRELILKYLITMSAGKK